MKNFLISIAVLLCGYNFTAFAKTLTVETVTEALNYDGDRTTVTKLVVTGQIACIPDSNYISSNSEWSKFRTLDETFPNIEAVKILTDQDIPDWNIYGSGLFY